VGDVIILALIGRNPMETLLNSYKFEEEAEERAILFVWLVADGWC
jgi:hypothetical protein